MVDDDDVDEKSRHRKIQKNIKQSRRKMWKISFLLCLLVGVERGLVSLDIFSVWYYWNIENRRQQTKKKNNFSSLKFLLHYPSSVFHNIEYRRPETREAGKSEI